MKIEFTLPSITNQPPFDIFEVKKWGEDDDMVKHGYTTDNLSIGGNFHVVGIIAQGEDGFAHSDQVSQSVEIDRDSIDKISSLQHPDETFSVDDKMRWLMNGTSGRPYFFDDERYKWQDAPYVLFGPMVYGGQLVAVDKYVTLFGSYRSYKRNYIACARLVCFTRNDWDKTYSSHPWLVQKATAVSKRPEPNTYIENPRGTIYAPLFAPTYGKFRGLAGYQPKEFFIPLEVIKPVSNGYLPLG